MRLFVTGGSGVIGRAFLAQAEAAGHLLTAPGRDDLDLFDQAAVTAAVSGTDAALLNTQLTGAVKPTSAATTTAPPSWRLERNIHYGGLPGISPGQNMPVGGPRAPAFVARPLRRGGESAARRGWRRPAQLDPP
jgi:hypothetical protein